MFEKQKKTAIFQPAEKINKNLDIEIFVYSIEQKRKEEQNSAGYGKLRLKTV